MHYSQYLCLITCFLIHLTPIYSQTLNNIESVEYDPVNDQFLISNGSNIIAQNYPEESLAVFGNARASHGMEIINNTLYTIDGTYIRGYSLIDGSTELNINISGAQFLNGLTSDSAGLLYATDFSKQEILKIDVTDTANPSIEVIINNTQTTPNGIHLDKENNRLIYVSWGSNAAIRAVDLSDYSISILANTDYGNMDGIATDIDNNYYISTWSPPRIIKFDPDFMNAPIEIETPGVLNNPADITIAKDRGLLAIPHYPQSGDEVMYVELNEVIGVSADNLSMYDQLSLSISPNPVKSTAKLNFTLKVTSAVEITLVDIEGNIIQSLYNGRLSAGSQSIIYEKYDEQTSGLFYIKLRYDEGNVTVPVVLIAAP